MKKLKGYSKEYFDRKVEVWAGKQALLATWEQSPLRTGDVPYVIQLQVRVNRLRKEAGINEN